VARRVWFDRVFELGLAADTLPDILERLRGTPARLEERLRGIPNAAMTPQVEGRWSIQENVGHLLDLEPLWAGRVEDLASGAPRLRPADLLNRATDEARHNESPLKEILNAFRQTRAGLVGRIESFEESDLSRTALHPRLRLPMTVVDLAFFVAEHDDHHLARITELRRALDV
jgi:uncharacterized damage-inducible protein DinB